MTFQESLRKELTPELYAQVMEALGDDFDMDVVPRARLNKVIAQRNDLREQVRALSDPDNGGDNSGAGSGNSGTNTNVDVDALKRQMEAEKTEAIKQVQIQYAVLEKLRAAGAIDAELIYKGGLIDTSKVQVAEDGTVTGVAEQIAELQKNRANLFTESVPSGTGKQGGADPFKGITTRADLLKLSADQQIAFKQANPTLFQQFLAQGL